MPHSARPEQSLETLKLINAAATAIRLYPDASVRVLDAIESSYQRTKSFLREGQLLRFSFLDGTYMLNGEPVNNQIREHLQLLTFGDQLQRMALGEMVLTKEMDRATFRKMLTVLSTTPEHVQQAGGSRPFIEQLGLTEIFPEMYFAPGESESEQKQKRQVDRVLHDLSGGEVPSEQIRYLVGRKEGRNLQLALEKSCQSSSQCARVVATTTYTLLQILLKDHIVVTASAFSVAMEKITSFLPDDTQEKVSGKAATLLAPHLDETSALMLVCQNFSSPFGNCFYDALLRSLDGKILKRVIDWMKAQDEKARAGSLKSSSQLLAVVQGYEKLQAHPRGKHLLVQETTRKLLAKTEYARKEKRVQAGIMALANGDLESLRNEEVCLNLPATIENLLNNEKEPVAAAIIQKIANGLKNQDHRYRSRLAQSIGGVAEKLVHLERWDWLEKLMPVCLSWVRENEKADQSFTKYIMAMQAMMDRAWNCDKFDLAESILAVFYHIRAGDFEQSDDVRKIVARVQDKNVNLKISQMYLDKCFVRPVDEEICLKIVMQGPVAAKFLLDTLFASEKRSDRIRLLKILNEVGHELVPVLLERLPDSMPWFGKRNIIRLLAGTGSEQDVEAVLEYASYDDLRVQEETLQCIAQIGGASTERFLLKIIDSLSVQMKVQAVKHLRRVAGGETVDSFCKLLEESRLYSGSERKLLVFEMSRTLTATKNVKAFPLLQTIIDGGGKQFGNKSVQEAKDAIRFIQEHGHWDHESLNTSEHKGKKVFSSETISTVSTESSLAGYNCITDHPEEREAYQLLADNKKEAAKKLLFELIEKEARLNRIKEAEALRRRVVDIDPMALTEIV